MIEDLLNETLRTIERERTGTSFHRAFELVDQLLAVFGEDRLASRLYAAIPQAVRWEVVADLFGILIWSTSDNGHGLTLETDQWLRDAEDLRKVQIALNLDCYPFLEASEMEAVLSMIAARFPEAARTCQELLASRSHRESSR